MMMFGVAYFPTEDVMAPDQFARACEDRGFESIFVPEHTHTVPSDTSEWRGSERKPPPWYERVYDPLVSLAAMSAVTSDIRLATGICLVPQRDVIILAKEIATLDRISSGRFMLGVGAGWSHGEMRNHGVDPRRRYELLQTKVEAIRTIWGQDVSTPDESLVKHGPILQRPKPLQPNGPPILVGGQGDKATGAAMSWGDEWLPNASILGDGVVRAVQRFASRREGRVAQRPGISVFDCPPDPDLVMDLRRAGAARVIRLIPQANTKGMLAHLDEWVRIRDACTSHRPE